MNVFKFFALIIHKTTLHYSIEQVQAKLSKGVKFLFSNLLILAYTKNR